MICIKQDLLLNLYVLNLVLLKHYVFVKTLHRVDLSILGVFYQEHFTERTFVDDLLNDKVFKLDVFIFLVVLVREDLCAGAASH